MAPTLACSESGDVGSATLAVNSDNALSMNRLSMNRLSMNRLSMNRLSMNRLSMNRLSMNSLDSEGIENNEEGRDLLRYVARCALSPNDILVVESGGLQYEFPGLLELAPQWEDGALTASEERLVSACLIAHVNAYGVSVGLSMRAPGKLLADSAELSAFPVYEGTFFGQVFAGDTLKAFSCVGSNASMAAKHSSDRGLRACADDSDDCSIVSVGRCKDVCQTRSNRYGWQNCEANGELYPETVSVYLRDADLDGSNQSCDGDNCYLTATSGQSAILDCSDSSYCDADCVNGSSCSLSGADSDDFFGWTQASDAETDCGGAESCGGVCRAGSSCEVDCFGAEWCGLACSTGSECLLDCTNADECGFTTCQGGVLHCPNDVVVCNRSCPATDDVGTCGDGICNGSEDSNSCASDCGPAPAANSCAHPDAACGSDAPAGCWCDSQCSVYGDCCSDYTSVCQ